MYTGKNYYGKIKPMATLAAIQTGSAILGGLGSLFQEDPIDRLIRERQQFASQQRALVEKNFGVQRQQLLGQLRSQQSAGKIQLERNLKQQGLLDTSIGLQALSQGNRQFNEQSNQAILGLEQSKLAALQQVAQLNSPIQRPAKSGFSQLFGAGIQGLLGSQVQQFNPGGGSTGGGFQPTSLDQITNGSGSSFGSNSLNNNFSNPFNQQLQNSFRPGLGGQNRGLGGF